MAKYVSKVFYWYKTKTREDQTKKALTNHEFHETLTDEMINALLKDNKPPLTNCLACPHPQSHNPLICLFLNLLLLMQSVFYLDPVDSRAIRPEEALMDRM